MCGFSVAKMHHKKAIFAACFCVGFRGVFWFTFAAVFRLKTGLLLQGVAVVRSLSMAPGVG